jgi:hypothetical protein
VPKAPRSAFRYFWGNPRERSNGRSQPSATQRAVSLIRPKVPPIYKRHLRQESSRKFLEPGPNAAGTPALDWQMKEQPNSPYEFWTHVYPIRLPHRSSMAGTRLVSRLTTASRRQKRGLDTSLAPRPIFPPGGDVQAWPSVALQRPRPRPRPPRSWSRPTWGVFSGSGACV